MTMALDAATHPKGSQEIFDFYRDREGQWVKDAVIAERFGFSNGPRRARGVREACAAGAFPGRFEHKQEGRTHWWRWLGDGRLF